MLKKVKITAAREDKSLSELVREVLRKKIDAEDGYLRARRNHGRVLERAFNFGTGGEIAVVRKQLHERK